jgi:hypothetical protein
MCRPYDSRPITATTASHRGSGEPAGEIDQSIAGAGTCATATIAAVANQAIVISSVEAYAQKSIAAGETIDFRVSSPVDYQLSIVRLGWDTDTSVRDWTLYTFPQASASQCSISPGSYVHVETALNPTAMFTELTLECWVRPFRTTSPSYWQGLISQHSYSGQCGFGLFLNDTNVPYYYFGNGGSFVPAWLRRAPSPLSAMQWHHVAAVLNAGSARLYVDGVQVDSARGVPAAVTPGPAPLRLGAYGDDSWGTSYFLDGDLAMPVIYRRALSGSEIAARAGVKPPQVPVDSAVIGCWPLDEERGALVADVSGCGRTGTIVNRGTWMIGGPGFDADGVPRFGTYNPDTDATRGHGLRLSSSDLYDCAWPISKDTNGDDLSYTLPSDCLPGVYVGRIIYADPNDQTTKRYDVTFVVRRATSRPYAPVLVLCSTNTWKAYNNAFQLHSFYDNHASGQPTYYQGFEMPWTFSTSAIPDTGGTAGGADPYLLFPNSNPNYSHLVRTERFLHVWLEQNGYDYDVISDRDLHSLPSILSNYRTLFIAGHSEYWTMESWSAVQSYLASGGNVIVASGNTMFWRVSYDNSVIECRKLPESVGGRPNAKYGELYHEHDHQRGGLMREAGYPGWQLTGLECDGYDYTSFPYVVTNRMHVLFHTPEAIAVQNGNQLGGPYGVGHEYDVTLNTLRTASFSGSTPPPMSPPDYTPSVLAQARSSISFDYAGVFNPNVTTLRVASEIAEWVWSSGGRVFSAGSIAASQALHADGKMAALFRNALHHNGVVFRLNVLAIGQDGHFDLRDFDGSAWSAGWDDHGAGFTDNPPTGVQWAPNSLAAMAITSAGSFYYKYNVGAGWSPWNDYGGTFQGRPAAVGWGRNRLDLFARGLDNRLWWKAWDGSTFTDWVDLGGPIGSDPAAISWEGRRLSVAVRGTGPNILYRNNINGTWSPGWTDMGGTGAPFTADFAYAPTMVVFGGNRLALFAVDTAGRAWVKHWDGTSWYPSLTGWIDLGWGGLAGRVHAASWGPDSYTVFGVGRDGRLKAKGWNGSSQTTWIDLGGSLVGEPAVASYRGSHLSVFGVAPDGRVQHLLWNGSTWSEWQDFGGTMRHSPAVFRWVRT